MSLIALVMSEGVAIPASVKVLFIQLVPFHFSISPLVFEVMSTSEWLPKV